MVVALTLGVSQRVDTGRFFHSRQTRACEFGKSVRQSLRGCNLAELLSQRDQLPAEIVPVTRLLTAAEFHRLADVPPEVEWFANLSNVHTRRVYENAIRDFIGFTGIVRPEEFRIVTRAHIIKWRDELVRRGLGGATIRHWLASLASLFEYLCEKNAVTHNPVKGVERPRTESGEGKTPAIGDHQARKLLDAPRADTIKSKRDRAMLSTLLFHALRRDELCKLKVRDFRHSRKGVPHLRVSGKGGKTRYLPRHPGTNALIHDYLAAAGRDADEAGALFRPIRNNRTGRMERAITADGVYKLVRAYFSGSRSARTRYAPPPAPTRLTITPTSPRCRNGSPPMPEPPGSTVAFRQSRGRASASIHSRTTIEKSRWHYRCWIRQPAARVTQV
jgi:site-specific recombinase XerC